MWRETDIGGILITPLAGYIVVAFLIYLPLRWLLVWLRLFRWTWNPALAEAGLYLCILGALVGFL